MPSRRALTDAARLRHRAGDARRLRPPLPAVPPGQRRGQGALRGGRLARPAARAGAAHRVLRPAGRRGGRAAADASSRPRRCRWTSGSRSSCTTSACSSTTTSPSCAETFFNSVTTKILHRSYFHNDFIFVRPAVSTEYIENDEPAALPTYRAYYPTRDDAARDLAAHRQQLPARSASSRTSSRDIDDVLAARATRSSASCRMRANFQIQVLSSLFFRNKGAYVVGKIINGFTETPFALPILHGARGELVDRHRAVRRGRPAAAVQLRARLLHGRRWRCRRPTCSSCAR